MNNIEKLQNYALTMSCLSSQEPIQVLDEQDQWQDWPYSTPPVFIDWKGFRRKPYTRTYRIGLFKSCCTERFYLDLIRDYSLYNSESDSGFQKWLTDPIELTLEVELD